MSMSPTLKGFDADGKPLTNSNEKYEQRYKEIIKENDGKLFEVHQKKGQNGVPLSNVQVIRTLPHPLMMLPQLL